MATHDADLGDSATDSAAEQQSSPTLAVRYRTPEDGSFQTRMSDGIRAISEFLAGVPYKDRPEDLRDMLKVQARLDAALAESRARQR